MLDEIQEKISNSTQSYDGRITECIEVNSTGDCEMKIRR